MVDQRSYINFYGKSNVSTQSPPIEPIKSNFTKYKIQDKNTSIATLKDSKIMETTVDLVSLNSPDRVTISKPMYGAGASILLNKSKSAADVLEIYLPKNKAIPEK